MLARHFGPENMAVDTTWAGDITYVRTWEGWAYLASVMDLASRRIVGWAIADHMEASLVVDAMAMALADRRPLSGLLFHSDYAEDRVKPRNGGVGVCGRGSLTGSSA